MVDSKGILGKHRRDIYLRRAEYVQKWHLCQITNAEELKGDIDEALRGADVVIALSTPGPGTIKPEWIKTDGERCDRVCRRQSDPRNLAVGSERSRGGGGRDRAIGLSQTR